MGETVQCAWQEQGVSQQPEEKMRPVIVQSMTTLDGTEEGKQLVDLVRKMAQYNASHKKSDGK